MALTSGYGPQRRGAPPASGSVFGGLVAAGEQIWRGGMIAWNAAGTLQRLQTAGSVAFAGLAAKDFYNAGTVAACSPPMEALKGVFALSVPGAAYANINQPVFATDDNTFTLTGTLAATFALGAGDTGTGGVGSITVASGTKPGAFALGILTGGTTYSVTDPTADVLSNGTLGVAYSGGGLGFTLSNKGTAFVSGDTATITVSEAPGAMQVGTLAGIENGTTYVKLLGS